jgi:hypothetical protein
MKRSSTIVVVLVVLTVAVLALAQTQSPQSQVPGTNDFSGMYSFLQEGEFVQISLEEQGKVTGFISRFGDLPSDKGAFLDQFIKTGTTDGKKIAFTTEPVHGTWFEFAGTVDRGDGKTANDDAYYVIRGKLTKYAQDANKKTSAESRDVMLKSFPQDAVIGPSKRD